MAVHLYLFISRDQVNSLAKLGPLAEHLSDMVANDLRQQKGELKQIKLTEQEAARSQAGSMGVSSKTLLASAQSQAAAKKAEKAAEEAHSLKQKPFAQPRAKEFFAYVKKNDVLKCLDMVKANPALVTDCDEERKTALHWACQLDLTNLVQVLVDFGANTGAKDDFARRPADEAQAYAQLKKVPVNRTIQALFDEQTQGKLRRDTGKYDQPLYVKYLTPVEQVKELADFISRVNDMSTLTQKQRDAKAAEQQRLKALEKMQRRAQNSPTAEGSSSSASDVDTDEDEDVGKQVRNVHKKYSLDTQNLWNN